MPVRDTQNYERMSREELLERLRALQSDPRLQKRLPEAQRLIHDLQVHQVELEMQNRELREAQAQLLESNARYTDLYDFAPVAYCSLREDTRIEEANLTAAVLFRVERASLVGRRLSALVGPDDRKPLREHVQRCFREKQRGSLELRASSSSDGSEAVVQLVTMPVLRPDGTVTACRAALTDISPLKRTERMLGLLAKASAALASSLRDREAIEEVANLLVPDLADACLVDLVERTTPMHRIWVPGAKSGKAARGKAHAATPDEPPALQAEVIRTGKPIFIPSVREAANATPELEPILADAGSLLLVPLTSRAHTFGVLTLAMIKSARRYLPSDLAFAQDLASRMAVAIESARLYHDAQHASQARDEVLSLVSHDLRSPVSAILLASRALEDLIESPKAGASRAIAVIRHAGENMGRMIGDLLDASSIDTGHLALDRRQHALRELIADAAESLKSLALEKQLDLNAESPPERIEVLCDRQRILQVFSNLIGNAIKFTPKGGTISVSAVPYPDEVRFFVRDTGPGIDPSILPRLFKRYGQAEDTAARGRGLGLYICKGIVEAHGGRIWAENQPGRGTAIVFTLPLPARRKPPATEQSGDLSVLVVDDDEPYRQGARLVLEAAGYVVAEAEDGLQALELLRSGGAPPMLILLDLQMPEMDGWGFMSELKKDAALASIPVVLVSGYRRLAAEAQALGVQGYILKPLRKEQLLETLEHFRPVIAPD